MTNGTPSRYPTRAAAYAAGIAAFAAVMASGLVKCPMALLFHVPCPACGSTRAARALASLDFAEALHMNPVAPVVLVALAGLALRAVVLAYRDGSTRRVDEEKIGRALIKVVVWATVVETIVWGARFFGLFGGPCPV